MMNLALVPANADATMSMHMIKINALRHTSNPRVGLTESTGYQ